MDSTKAAREPKTGVQVRGFQLRAYPTPEQARTLDQASAAAAMFWNDIVGWWRDAMKQAHRMVYDDPRRAKRLKDLRSKYYISSEVSPAIKELVRPEWAPDVAAKFFHGVLQDFQQSVERWNTDQRNKSGAASWRSKRTRRGLKPKPTWMFGAPMFVPAGHRGNIRWSNQLEAVLVRTGKRRCTIRVPKVGLVEASLDSGYPAGANIKSVRMRRDAEGKWWFGLSIEVAKKVHAPAQREIVGLDRGVVIPVAASEGLNLLGIDGLTPGERARLRRTERRIARIHRMMSPACHAPGARCTGRCGFGRPIFKRLPDGTREFVVGPSKNLLALRREVARLKALEVRRRQHARHTFTSVTVDRFDAIVLEDLSIKSMMASAKGSAETPGAKVRQKAGLNRGIAAVGWYELERQLTYKSKWRGRTGVVKVPAPHTSQTCSSCGHVDAANRVTQDRFVCRSCGMTTNADRNAAQVIAQRGWSHLHPDLGPDDAPGRPREEAVESDKGLVLFAQGSGNQSYENVGIIPLRRHSERSNGRLNYGKRSKLAGQAKRRQRVRRKAA